MESRDIHALGQDIGQPNSAELWVNHLQSALAERDALTARVDQMEAALIRARAYIVGEMLDRSGPIVRQMDDAISALRGVAE